MSIMPNYQNLPPWLRIVGRALRMGTYVGLMSLAIGDMLFTLDHPGWEGNLGDWGSLITGVMALLGLIAVIWEKWRWEWIITFCLAAIITTRAAFVWTIPGPPPPISNGSLTLVLGMFLFLRGIDLTVFGYRSSLVVNLNLYRNRLKRT